MNLPGAQGTLGQVLTASGSNGTSYTTAWSQANVPNETLKIKQGDPPELEVRGRMVLNGRDLEERLNTIEKVLQIPERDVTLETKHPRLKKLYDEYITALEEYRTWNRLTDD